jgi:lysophospholipase L1-like esterase
MRTSFPATSSLTALALTAGLLAGCQGESQAPEPTPTTTEQSTAPITPTSTTTPPPDPHERNAQNFRDDHDYAVAKPEGVTRVLVIGDSMAFGWGVDLKDGLAEQTEQKMNAKAPDKKVEVLNLSQPAFNTLAEIALLKTQGLAYKPDVVVLAYTLDDALSGQETELGDVSKTAQLLAGYVLGKLDAADQQKVETYLKDNGWEKSLDEAKAAKPTNELYATYFVGHSVPLYWEPVQNHLKELAGLAKAEHTKVVVAIIPSLGQSWDGYPFAKLHARVQKEFESKGFKVVDFLPALSKVPSAELTQGGGYPNAKAHSMMAEELANALLSDQTPPPSPD